MPHFVFAIGLLLSFRAGLFITNDMEEDVEENYNMEEKALLRLLGGWRAPRGVIV